MPYKPTSLIIEGVLSIERIEYSFNQNQTTVITGTNKDGVGQKSNGSGKSAFLEGISLAILNDPFRNINLKGIIGNGRDKAYVSFTLENKSIQSIITVNRYYWRNKSSKSELWENGVQNTKLIDSDDVTKRILELLDISKEDILNYYLISKSKYKSFFLTTDGKKKEIIARFSNANIVDSFIEKTRTKVKSIQSEYNEIEKELIKLTGKSELLIEQKDSIDIESEKTISNGIIKSNKEKILSLQKEIKGYKILIEGEEKVVKDISKQILQFDISKHQLQYSKIVETIKKIETQSDQFSGELVEIKKLQKEIEIQLQEVIKCPKCSHEFTLTEEGFNIDEARKIIQEIDTDIKDLQSKIDNFSLKKSAKLIEKKKEDDIISQYEREKRELESDKNRHELALSNLQHKILSFNNQIQSCKESIDFENEKDFTDPTEKINTQLNEISIQIKEIEKQLSVKQTEIDKYSKWEIYFLKFKTYLTNQSLKVLEGYVNQYLSLIQVNINILINGFRELSNKKTKEEIEVLVLKNGEIIGEFDTLSGGEKARTDICGILTNQKLINLNSKSGGLDLLVLDEIIEAVDDIGVEQILSLLSKTNQSILFITHSGGNVLFDETIKTINIVKEKGISRIV